jgi:prevent-host-death family protein
MQRVGARELKNRLGKYLRAVRAGQRLVITTRGKAIAELGPSRDTEAEPDTEKQLQELEVQGLIRLAKKPLRKIRPIASRGKAASRLIIEDRR